MEEEGECLGLAAGALEPSVAHVSAHEAGDAGQAALRLAHVAHAADMAHSRVAIALAVACRCAPHTSSQSGFRRQRTRTQPWQDRM